MISITTKSPYALRALVELHRRGDSTPVPIAELARRGEIPVQFLEQLFATLRRAGMLRSQRGVKGGYSFARPADEITVLELVELLDGSVGNGATACSRMRPRRRARCWRIRRSPTSPKPRPVRPARRCTTSDAPACRAAGADSRARPACALSRPAPAAASARVPHGFVGMDVDGPLFPATAPGVDISRQMDKMVTSGVESIRVVFDWAAAQPYAHWSDVPAAEKSEFTDAGGVPTRFGPARPARGRWRPHAD